ncbi:MAG: YdcF family protein [Micavibrio sp.]
MNIAARHTPIVEKPEEAAAPALAAAPTPAPAAPAPAPPACRGLSSDFYQAAATRTPEDIENYLLVRKTEIAPAPIILLFGNPHTLGPSAAQGAALYHAGFARTIIVTGGKTVTGKGQPEAHCLYDLLRGHDIPKGDILVEDRSENTKENVLLAKSLYEAAQPYGGAAADSLIAVGHAIAGRRFLMTVAANWPAIKLPMASNVWHDEEAGAGWAADIFLRPKVYAQFDRIAPYAFKGDIAEIDLDRINIKAAERKRTPYPCP